MVQYTKKQNEVIAEFGIEKSEYLMMSAINYYLVQKSELQFWLEKLAVQDAYLITDECVGEKRSRCFKKRDEIYINMRPVVHGIDALETVFNLSK
tara:strand:+ start:3642 stop:3926 length:285 start_codon:yes stop_codon:yes gene_type:complete